MKGSPRVEQMGSAQPTPTPAEDGGSRRWPVRSLEALGTRLLEIKACCSSEKRRIQKRMDEATVSAKYWSMIL